MDTVGIEPCLVSRRICRFTAWLGQDKERACDRRGGVVAWVKNYCSGMQTADATRISRHFFRGPLAFRPGRYSSRNLSLIAVELLPKIENCV